MKIEAPKVYLGILYSVCKYARQPLYLASPCKFRRRDNMDRASQILAQGVPPGVPRSYCALADNGNVTHSTLHHRASG